MKHCRLAILIYLALVAQTSLAPEFRCAGCVPDFLLLVVIAALVTCNDWKALAWAAGAGFLSDCLAPSHLGLGLVVTTLGALIVQSVFRRDAHWSMPAIAVLSLVFIFTCRFVVFSIRAVLVAQPVNPADHVLILSGQAAYSAVIGIFCLLLARWIGRILPVRSDKSAGHPSRNWSTTL